MAKQASQAGFTLVELLVVLGIIVVILAVVLVNIGQVQPNASLGTTVDTLLSDLKSQQLLAMTGDTGSTTAQQPHGIFVQSSQYTLYANSTYSAGDTNNFVVTAGPGISFSTTLPSAIVLFNKGAGDVNGYVAGSNTITVTRGTASKVITISRFGATVVN